MAKFRTTNYEEAVEIFHHPCSKKYGSKKEHLINNPFSLYVSLNMTDNI